MAVTGAKDSPAALEEAMERYNAAWNAHDLHAIMAMHAPDMVFENHTAGESAQGVEVREHIGRIFESWPTSASMAAAATSATASWCRSGPRRPRTRRRSRAATS